MSEQKPLHRLFGLSWRDFFHDTAIVVETERDLSEKQQFVDLVLIRKGPDPIPRRMPDGLLEDLSACNLITFKSHQETLDAWALLELVGHYVNYRKQYSPSMDDLLPETDFRLFAVCVRFPNNLARQVPLTLIREGVYEVAPLTLRIRLIVVHQLPLAEQNAMLHLFSAREELIRYGKEHYQPHCRETSTVLVQLFKAYSEDPTMSKVLEEFARQTIEDLLKELPAEELRKRLTPKQRLEGLTPEERLEGLPAEELLKRLTPEQLRDALEKLDRQQGGNGTSEKPQ